VLGLVGVRERDRAGAEALPAATSSRAAPALIVAGTARTTSSTPAARSSDCSARSAPRLRGDTPGVSTRTSEEARRPDAWAPALGASGATRIGTPAGASSSASSAPASAGRTATQATGRPPLVA
jgi:hypothetical protein